MMTDPRAYVVAHPARVFLTACPLLALFSLTPTPHLVPTVALITALRIWSWISLPRPDQIFYQVSQVLLVSLAAGATQLAPSLRALSTPATSLIVLSLISVSTSTIAFVTLFVTHRATRLVGASWIRLTMFPALWASSWGLMSHVSPLGHLASWSPVLGLGPYGWTRQFFGQWSINWIAAAWAVVLSDVLGDWLVGASQQEPLAETRNVLIDTGESTLISSQGPPHHTTGKPAPAGRGHSLPTLTAVLLLLMVPSYLVPSLPLPPQSQDTTPFTVGCALPVVRTTGKVTGLPTLQNYIDETKTIQAYAPVVLWPEAAVRFESLEAKQSAFKRIQEMPLGRGRFVGVSFEDYTPARVEHGVYYPALRRNGFALLGHTGPPVMEYYKRSLVPIAESFSFTPGTEDPAIYTIDLPPPKSYNKTDWSPLPNHTRPIPVSASICFDFASPAPFGGLPSRPAIIFAPARTWHIGIGNAMWEQAKARAKETGSVVVWCDGGAGGVSGVASRGHNELLQVGQGTWTQTIGLQWPFDTQPTPFIRDGPLVPLATVWVICGLGWLSGIAFRRQRSAALLGSAFTALCGFVGYARRRAMPSGNDEERSLLHD